MKNPSHPEDIIKELEARRKSPSTMASDRYFAPLRFVAILGVASSTLLATFLFLATAIHTVALVIEYAPHLGKEETVHKLVLASVEQADTLLIATALMIVGFGLYGLFVDAMDSLPRWLRISTIDELKSKLLGVVVVALGVHFFASAYEHAHEENLLIFGASVGIVIVSLALYVWAQSCYHKTEHTHEESEI